MARCTKRVFATRKAARAHAAAYLKEFGRQRPYKCPEPEHFGLWHLTSQNASHTTYYRENPRKRRPQP